jgi:hypothetical protein
MFLTNKTVNTFLDLLPDFTDQHFLLSLQEVDAHRVDDGVGEGAQVVELEVNIGVLERQPRERGVGPYSQNF